MQRAEKAEQGRLAANKAEQSERIVADATGAWGSLIEAVEELMADMTRPVPEGAKAPDLLSAQKGRSKLPLRHDRRLCHQLSTHISLLPLHRTPTFANAPNALNLLLPILRRGQSCPVDTR